MPKTKISEFSATAGNNTDIDGINIAEGCAPSGINDAIRELMAQLKDFQAGTAGDSFNGPIGSTTPAAGTFTNLSASGTFALTGDQVQISEGGTGQTTANAAFNALAPSQTSQAGKYLKTDGTNTSWDALDISTADITGTLPIANGGTGLTALGTGVQTALGQNVTGSGGIVLATSPSLTTPNLGTPSAATLTNATGLPLTTGVTGTLPVGSGGTGTATAFTAGSVVFAGASGVYSQNNIGLFWDNTNASLGVGTTTPISKLSVHVASGAVYARVSSGVKTLLMGGLAGASAEISSSEALIFGAGSGYAERGRFSTDGTFRVTGAGTAGSTDAVQFSGSAPASSLVLNSSGNLTLASPGTFTYSSGTANGVAYLNGSKVLTTGSALTYDGTTLAAAATANGANVEVLKASNIGSGDNTQASIGFYAAGTKYSEIIGGYSGGSSLKYNATTTIGYHQWQINGSEQARLTSTGLGIGTSSPNARLEVRGTGATQALLTSTTDTTVYLRFNNTTHSGGYVGYTSDNLIFLTGASERMRLDSSGNLGIGTSSPAVRLNVVDSSGNTFAAAFRGVGGTNLVALGTTSGGAAIAGYTAGFAATADLIINPSGGNLGLGVTPRTATSTYKAFEFGQSGYLAAVASSAGVALASNAYIASGAVYTYSTTGVATNYIQASGQHQWYTAASGTAGNAISFTQALTLDASGLLGIGTTSPSSYNSGGNNLVVGGSASYRGMTIASTVEGNIYFADGTTGTETYRGIVGYNHTSDYMVFYTAANERARITSGGYFKASNNGTYVGSTATYHEFVSNSADWTVYTQNTNATTPKGIVVSYTGAAPNGTGSQFLYCGDNAVVRAEIRSNGGLANYSGNNVNLSDRREKTNFAPAKSYLDTICAIPVQTFNYIDQSEDDPGLTLGVVAQDVQAVAPELVMESNWGTEDDPKMRLSIYQTDLQYALMKCIQELKAQNDDLRARVAQLEAK